MAKATQTAPKRRRITTAAQLQQAIAKPTKRQYVLRLYITGMTPRSTRAVENLKAICEQYLQGHYELEIIDIYQHPSLMQGEQIIAAPTLIKKLPMPLRRLVGDMSNTERVLLGLDLKPKHTQPARRKE